MRVIDTAIVFAALLVFPATTSAQLSFPTSTEDYPHFYPTAYYDHGSLTDWNCGDITYSGHNGSDFGGGGFTGMEEGRDITAASDATVLYTNDGEYDECTTGDCDGGGGYGNYVWVEDVYGNEVIYAHMAQWSVEVSPGDEVVCGQLLGLMGSSGHSTGPHLHFEIRNGAGDRIDPFEGGCSETTPTMWVGQGPYDGLPLIQCGEPAECIPAQTITCGDTVSTSNDGPGSQSATFYYGCTEWMYTGPEISYEFITDLDEPVTVSLTGNTADLDLYALESALCNGEGCITASDNSDDNDEEVTFDAESGEPIVIVVDGYEGATSDFTLSVICDGGLPEDPVDGGTDTDTDTDTDSDSDADSDSDSDADSDSDSDADSSDEGAVSSSNCGCSAVDMDLSKVRHRGLPLRLIGLIHW